MKRQLYSLLFLLFLVPSLSPVFAQQKKFEKDFIIGYETLEMTMNKFRYFAGEVGYRISRNSQIRLMIGEVNLTERHLSSKYEAVAVDGENVEGYFRIYELNYDRFFGKNKRWYYGGNIGYVYDQYKHKVLGNELENHTFALGPHIGFQEMDLFGVNHLYINISMPFRYYFNPIPEQQWGGTKILEHKFVNNLWLFVGFRF